MPYLLVDGVRGRKIPWLSFGGMAEPLLHLITLEEWARRRSWEPLRSASLATEGFAHCTVGDELMLHVANQFYRHVQSQFVVLSIDRMKLTSPLRWERPQGADALAHVAFPHVYGLIDVRSISAHRRLVRTDDGTFAGYSSSQALVRGMSIVIPVSDMGAALVAYEQLGFVAIEETVDGTEVSRDGVRLVLQPVAAGISRSAQVVLWVTDADALFAEWSSLDQLGTLIEPVDVEHGGRQGSYIDVDGNLTRFGSFADDR